MKRCPVDAANYKDDLVFCPYCGAVLENSPIIQRKFYVKRYTHLKDNQDGTCSLTINNQSFTVPIEELGILKDEIEVLLNNSQFTLDK